MKIRKYATGFLIWCPGCNEAHLIDTSRWKWDGNEDSPTVHPSLKISTSTATETRVKCHFILTKGIINFCGDCAPRTDISKFVLPLYARLQFTKTIMRDMKAAGEEKSQQKRCLDSNH